MEYNRINNSLLKSQFEFSRNIARLITYIYKCGYTCSIGVAYAVPCSECGHFNHLKDGAHPKRLAVDLNLFKYDVYLTKTEDHARFGKYWKLYCNGIWGGDFPKPDGNHYEGKLL